MTTVSKTRGLGGEGDKNGLDLGAKGGQSVLETNHLPPELVSIFEDLKRFLKQQKMIKEENSEQRFNVEPILKIDENIKYSLHKIEVDLQSNAKQVELLKKETTKLLSNGEVAYRLVKAEIPSNMYVNKYFISLMEDFENQMNTYSKQIKVLENHIKNMNKPYSPEELFSIMRKQHETLIALAENVYLIHEQVNNLKQKGDKDSPTEMYSIPSKSGPEKSELGPNPFMRTSESLPVPSVEPTATVAPQQSSWSLLTSFPQTEKRFFPSSQSIFSSSPSYQPSKNKRWTPS